MKFKAFIIPSIISMFSASPLAGVITYTDGTTIDVGAQDNRLGFGSASNNDWISQYIDGNLAFSSLGSNNDENTFTVEDENESLVAFDLGNFDYDWFLVEIDDTAFLFENIAELNWAVFSPFLEAPAMASLTRLLTRTSDDGDDGDDGDDDTPTYPDDFNFEIIGVGSDYTPPSPPPSTEVPEPRIWGILAIALGWLGFSRYRKNKK